MPELKPYPFCGGEAEPFNALKSLVNGEWVDCKLVQEALGIDFNTGFKMFDFSRTAEWNPAPLNGQKITTKFKLKNAVEVVHGEWDKYQRYAICSECEAGFCYYKNEVDRFRYCPNCGAKMDGDGND